MGAKFLAVREINSIDRQRYTNAGRMRGNLKCSVYYLKQKQ